MPAIGLWNGDELGPRAVAIHANALGVRAKVTATGETVAAMSTSDVAFADNEIAFGKTFYVVPNAIDHADKLVPNGHRNRDGLLGPGIPVIYMYIGSADGGLQDADQDIVALGVGHRHFLKPESRLGFRFHDGLHRFLHETKLAAA